MDADGQNPVTINSDPSALMLDWGPASVTTPIAWGDTDCDGDITTRDNQGLLRAVLQQTPLSHTDPCPDIGDAAGNHDWGDWDCDTEVSTRDNQALLRFVLQQPPLSQSEPCPDLGTTIQIP